jgi:hypothetical protein
MKINFYIRPSRSDLKPIKMYIHLNGKRDYIHTGHHCREKDWDLKKQQVKPSAKNSVPINKKLSEMETMAFDALNGVSERLIDIEFVKNKFLDLTAIQTKNVMSTQQDFVKWFEEFIKESASRISTQGRVLSKGMVNHYQSCLNLLVDFQREEKFLLAFDRINADFYSKFRSYCMGKKLNPNTFGGKIKKIKTFLYWCEERDIIVSPKFKSFAIPQKYSDAEPLKGSEVLKLWKIKDPDYKLDIFLAMVSTGMRIGDYNKIMTNIDKYIKESQEGKAIVFNATKTGKKCVIPFFDDLYFRPVYLYKKYKGKMPTISGQKLNVWLKTQGISDIDVTSKTGRKTFCSIQYFEQGKEAQYIMASTGHATEQEFKKYIGVKADTIIKAHKEKATHLKVS